MENIHKDETWGLLSENFTPILLPVKEVYENSVLPKCHTIAGHRL